MTPPRPHAGLQQVPYDERFLACSWAWLNDPEIKRLTATPAFTREQQRVWFSGLAERRDYIIWGVEIERKPIGVFGIKHMINEEGEYWGYIGEKAYWGRRLGQWMLHQAVVEGQTRGLRRLYLHVIPENIRARCAYETFGFYTESESESDVIMSLSIE